MKEYVKNSNQGSILVECIASMAVLSILSLTLAKTISFSEGLAAKTQTMNQNLYELLSDTKRRAAPEQTEALELRFSMDDGREITVSASKYSYEKGGLGLRIAVPKETEDEYEDTVLE